MVPRRVQAKDKECQEEDAATGIWGYVNISGRDSDKAAEEEREKIEMTESGGKQIEKLKQLKKDYVDAFSTPHGKRVLADLEKKCFINKTTYSPEKGKIFWNEGTRYVIVHIKNMINFNLEKLEKLLREEN